MGDAYPILPGKRHEDMDQLGAGSWTERVQAVTESPLELDGSHETGGPSPEPSITRPVESIRGIVMTWPTSWIASRRARSFLLASSQSRVRSRTVVASRCPASDVSQNPRQAVEDAAKPLEDVLGEVPFGCYRKPNDQHPHWFPEGFPLGLELFDLRLCLIGILNERRSVGRMHVGRELQHPTGR